MKKLQKFFNDVADLCGPFERALFRIAALAGSGWILYEVVAGHFKS
jgi:hypothetical protein